MLNDRVLETASIEPSKELALEGEILKKTHTDGRSRKGIG